MPVDGVLQAFAKINPWSWLRRMSDNDLGILQTTGAPTNGTSGSYNGIAGKGCLLLDTTNGILYINTNTKASPTWTAIGSASPTFVDATLTGTTTIGSGATITSPTIVTPSISSLAKNFSTAQVTAGYATDTYLVGSNIAMPTGGFLAGARYRCMFDLVKTAAGTAQLTITLRIGVAGTTADAAILSFAFAAGTAAVDSGVVTIDAYFRTVGSGTSAVMVGECFVNHALAATGLISTGASGFGQLNVVSSGFDSTVAASIIGLSVNGGASFSGTNNMVRASLESF